MKISGIVYYLKIMIIFGGEGDKLRTWGWGWVGWGWGR